MDRSCILVFLFLFLTASSQLIAGGQSESSVIQRTGVLEYIEGEVFINNQPGSIGDSVNSDDIIKTGAKSYCEIVFGERNVFRLEKNTIAQIDWAKSKVQLNQGAIGAVFTKLNHFIGPDRNFTISTPSIAAGVRGTVFYIKIEDPQNTYLCICNGELDLTESYSGIVISSGHHQAYRFSNREGTLSYAPAPLLYHDDPKMESIADKIDYSIPWGKTRNKGY
ncbi:MAG: FecR domain-containing protein [Spirochaetes bacterium]|nr:FecR domain-containing protein [Spirochaetota bacterium]